ncbi:hypothetical protein [Labrys neptuniae]|uniref:Uncharacterized protein n=1 Tax=Labrys neptuniae TaxID=376174 RepID=A0ABV3PIK6_9HYPH
MILDDKNSLADALTDVRKAYRLLWAYQKRVFDVVRLIVSEFDDMGFYYWQTMHADRPCNSGTNPLARWTWDMLPMLEASYLFLPSGVDRNSTMPGTWMLEVHVESDSGFEDPHDGTEPNPEQFKDAALSKSKVSIYAWYCTGQTNLNWFTNVWSSLDWPENEQGGVVEYVDPPFKIFGRTLDLSALPSKESVSIAAAMFRIDASAALEASLE